MGRNLDETLGFSNGNGNGNGNGNMPMWLKAIVQLGAPAVIAIYLVYQLSNTVAIGVVEQRNLMVQHELSRVAMEGKLDGLLGHEQASLDVLILIQKVNCLHQSHSAAERQECAEASKR